MVILTNENGNEIRMLNPTNIDIDLNDTKDFVITINLNEYKSDLIFGNRLFIPDTEYGGIIGEIETNTEDNSVKIKGYGWRGILYTKIIQPPTGQDYYTISGELNNIIKILTSNLTDIFTTSSIDTGVSVNNFQFDRYCTLLDGLNKLLKSVNYRLNIQYIQGEQGNPGYVELSAVPIVDYSNDIQFSQDNRIDFILKNKQNGINHLICLGQGELQDRTVINLYVDENGNIGNTQYYTGIQEIAQTYENTGGGSEELQVNGTEKLKEIMNKKEMTMDLSNINTNLEIGDIVGGRDYITGNTLSTEITNKIYTLNNGEEKIEYEIKGDDA